MTAQNPSDYLAPLDALAALADEIENAEVALAALRSRRRELLRHAVVIGIPAAHAARAARISRNTLYALVPAAGKDASKGA